MENANLNGIEDFTRERIANVGMRELRVIMANANVTQGEAEKIEKDRMKEISKRNTQKSRLRKSGEGLRVENKVRELKQEISDLKKERESLIEEIGDYKNLLNLHP